MGKWRSEVANDATWRSPPHQSRQAYAAEQDLAAGGRENRVVQLSRGTALASVALRRKTDRRRVYAYLRWSDRGKTIERYIGQVNKPSRTTNLCEAWQLVARRGLIDITPPQPAPEMAEIRTSPKQRSWASSPAIRVIMRANKGRDTRPELAVRSAVHALGLRYRVGIRPVPVIRRTADIVFPREKVAVFVDGCFWHGCPEHHRPAKQNAEFWTAKIEGNIARDSDTDSRLQEAGWRVIRIWEHEQPTSAAERIWTMLRGSQDQPSESLEQPT